MGREQNDRSEVFSFDARKEVARGVGQPLAETLDARDGPAAAHDSSATVVREEQSLLSTVDAPGGSQTLASPTVPTPGPRFRILRSHARGGLGEVFIARDEELNRDVALKEIRGEHAHNQDSRGRFLLEAEITGGLEHPGIVPVYGLGHYPDGRPYYAMRFIQGDSLRESISAFHSLENSNADDSERTLQLRKLLGRFVDVCQAVSYAHSRGVLHRDLKPGNIMLGKYGETLVVDWGLAKVHGKEDGSVGDGKGMLTPASGDGVTPTVMGSALGTPAYMAPEQAAGRLDELGPTSDVYSLGATLYHLLTGKAPFLGDNFADILKGVQQGNFPRPTQANSAVPKPLEAVCLKAMALHPRDRYTSPQDLADDVERYLADEPVQAFPEPLPARTKRWIRKHPTLTTTTAAVVLLSTIGLGAFSSIVSGKNDQLTRLNQELQASGTALVRTNGELEQANADLTAANAREVEARKLAENNELAAKKQSQLALSMLSSVIFDLQRGLQDLPGGSEVRRRLLATSLEKLEVLAGKYVAQASVDRNTMVALTDMGEVILRFGTGEDARRKSIPLARQFYDRAHDIATKLAAAAPDNAEAQFDLGFSFHTLGDLHFMRLRESQTALEHYRESLVIFERLAADDPNNMKVQLHLSTLYYKLGDVHLQLQGKQPALEFYQKSNETLERLEELEPENTNVQLQLSVSYNRLADMHQLARDLPSARKFFLKSLAVRERLAAADPANAFAQRNLGVSYNNLGDLDQELGELESARGYYRKFNQICERLVADDPNDRRTQRDLAVSYENLGEVHLKLEDVASARDFFQKYYAIADRMASNDPTDVRAQRDLSVACERLGLVHLNSQDVTAALEFQRQSRDIRERLATADPSAESQRDLAIAYCQLGNVHKRSNDTQAALENYEQYRKISERLAAAHSTSFQAQSDLLDSLQRMGNLHLQVGQTKDAFELYGHANKVLQALTALAPENKKVQRELMVSHYELGKTSAALQDFDTSLTQYGTAIDILDQMISAGHEVQKNRQHRAQVLKERDSVELNAAQVRTALADWDTFIKHPNARSLLPLRIERLARASRFAEIPQSAELLRSLDSKNSENLYNAACGYARCAGAIAPAKGESLTADQQAQRQGYVKLSLACLKESIAAGWKDFDHLRQDPDLTVLRELEELRELLQRPE